MKNDLSVKQGTIRYLLQLTSKALTFLLRSVPKNVKHFTLHSIADLKPRVKRLIAAISKKYENNTALLTIQTDVEKMFTNLDHKEIQAAIKWLCTIYKDTLKPMPRTTRNSYKNTIYVQ